MFGSQSYYLIAPLVSYPTVRRCCCSTVCLGAVRGRKASNPTNHDIFFYFFSHEKVLVQIFLVQFRRRVPQAAGGALAFCPEAGSFVRALARPNV